MGTGTDSFFGIGSLMKSGLILRTGLIRFNDVLPSLRTAEADVGWTVLSFPWRHDDILSKCALSCLLYDTNDILNHKS